MVKLSGKYDNLTIQSMRIYCTVKKKKRNENETRATRNIGMAFAGCSAMEKSHLEH